MNTITPKVRVPIPGDTSWLPDAVRARIEEYQRLLEQRHEAATALDTMKRSRPDVEQADAEVAAAAIRSGKQPTGQAKLAMYEADLAAQRHRTHALTLAVEGAAADLISTFEAEQDDVVASREASMHEAEATFLGVLDQLVQAHDALVTRRGELGWALEFPHRTKPGMSKRVPLTSLNGDGFDPAETLAALRQVA